MEELNLTETEQRYFGDLFLCCDEESNGKVPILKATELFRSSNIPNDVLKQITDLSFPHNSITITHINRKQFYSALKLIAAHQANMSLRADLLTSSIDLPLPRFTWTLNSEADPDLIQLSNSPLSGALAKEQHIHKREKPFGTYEPMRLSSNSSDVDIPQNALQHDNIEAQSTDSEVESETISQRSDLSHTMRATNGSPWSTASESPTPTNSVAEQRAQGLLTAHGPWSATGPAGHGRWPAASIGEEHTQLLGTEEESSDRHSSDDETGESPGRSVWRVGPDQRRHYAAQFRQLQPDARGLVPGNVARLFFEKSRLPVADLRKIWLLSDVTKDGALCIEEFTTAMHLVVLRRKEIPVPDVLPPALIPRIREPTPEASPERIVTSRLVDLGSDTDLSLGAEFSSGTAPPPPASELPINETDDFDSANVKSLKREDGSPSPSPPTAGDAPLRANKPEALTGNREWTKFVDSPTSSVASPGPKPVNFDFQKAAVERDPKIFHPVPLRVTPDASSLPSQASESGGTSPRRRDGTPPNFRDSRDAPSPKRPGARLSVDAGFVPAIAGDIRPIQRPQAKKATPKGAGAIPPPPAKDGSLGNDDGATGPLSLQFAPKKEAPPPPPPRPHRAHTRSSSLDLNRFKSAHSASVGAPPQVPPRISPSVAGPQSKKLVNQRSEGDVLGLTGDPAFGTTDAFPRSPEGAPAETFADFARFPGGLPPPAADGPPVNLPRSRASFEDDVDNAPRKHGAFQVYRKPTPRGSESPDACGPIELPADLSAGLRSEDSLKRLREQNSLLCRLCRELSVELADVQRERESLRVRLETGGTAV